MDCALSGVISDVTAVFSDIDGTLAHYAKTLTRAGYVQLTVEEIDALVWPVAPSNEVEELLERCFPPTARCERFKGIPFQFWRHIKTGKVLKTYQLYNLSLTGAVISENTILLTELLQENKYLYEGLDADGSRRLEPVLFTLITGARSSTYLNRRKGGSLPFTAYDSCEGGGKLWCRLSEPSQWLKGQRSSTSQTFLPNTEIPPCDETWIRRFSAVTGYGGPSGQSHPNLQVPLWQVASLLEAQGFAIDRVDYDTSFLVNLKESPCINGHDDTTGDVLTFSSAEVAESYLKRLFASEYSQRYDLELFVNLGKAQINARGSGKKGVMDYIMSTMNEMDDSRRGRFCECRAVALFDDHNDLPFAESCGAGILPSVAHEDVLSHEQWAGDHKKWFRPPFDGLLGSEWALSQIVLHKRRQS